MYKPDRRNASRRAMYVKSSTDTRVWRQTMKVDFNVHSACYTMPTSA